MPAPWRWRHMHWGPAYENLQGRKPREVSGGGAAGERVRLVRGRAAMGILALRMFCCEGRDG